MTAVATEVQTDAADTSPSGYQLVAVDNEGLQAAHGKMVEWARGKQAECDTEGAEEGENLLHATANKWATAPFKKRIAMLERRRVFYKKIEDALLAGYVIVPNFEMTLFAIRTNAKAPRRQELRDTWRASFPQEPQLLPSGEGEYKNPTPTVWEHKEAEPDGKGGTKNVTVYTPAPDFSDINFPVALAKPTLMQKTAQALAVKLFDEIGVAVDTASSWRGNRRGDPIILGRIRNPRKAADVTFFIGWYFDPTNI